MKHIEKTSRESRKIRSRKHLTLGKLISYLQTTRIPKVANLTNPHSYRGYYEDLAFELGEGAKSRKEMLEFCKNLVGKTFEGYRGGSYKMSYDAPLWVANCGDCGKPFIKLEGTTITLG